MYAVGQGALGVECREGDTSTIELLAQLCHSQTMIATTAERAFMRTLEGGCSAPVAVHTKVKLLLFLKVFECFCIWVFPCSKEIVKLNSNFCIIQMYIWF